MREIIYTDIGIFERLMLEWNYFVPYGPESKEGITNEPTTF